MTSLESVIEVRHRNVRSINVELDLTNAEALDGYSLGSHVIDAIRRVVISTQDGARSRAWSVTGPYGSGKSSFAHFLSALFAGAQAPERAAAIALLTEVDPQLAETIDRERLRLNFGARGIIRCPVTVQQEGVRRSLVRALVRGADLYWSGRGRKPAILDLLHATNESLDDPSADELFELLDELISYSPVLLIADELGKALEYASTDSSGGDVFVLQQIAERFSAAEKFDGAILTLQHLAFEEYLAGATELRRREWRKVQGRFEDVPFIAQSDHAYRLLAESMALSVPAPVARDIERTAEQAESELAKHLPGVEMPSESMADAAHFYPLHPSAVLALPRLAARFGQHDRSLAAFLTSDGPSALGAFLRARDLDERPLPFLRLSDLYGYFIEPGNLASLGGPDGARAREIQARVSETRDLAPVGSAVLRTVAVINLIGGRDSLLATREVIREAVVGPAPANRLSVDQALDELIARSVLNFREFAGEFRLWEGSDFDVSAQIAAARDVLSSHTADETDILERISAVRPLRAAVARRHSQEREVLRYFDAVYTTQEAVSDLSSDSADADGLVAYVLGTQAAPASMNAQTPDGRPLVVVWSPYGNEIYSAAMDAVASLTVLNSAPELERDSVARREVRQRVVLAQTALAERIDNAFAPDRRNVAWFFAGERVTVKRKADFSRRVSDLCDSRFPQTPFLPNEMLNRRVLTSQGAKARRDLLERMFTHPEEERLGIAGYGPERAMYEAVLASSGLHRDDGGTFRFGPPDERSSLSGVWAVIDTFLDEASNHPMKVSELYSRLMAPPYGMKPGPLPVLLSVGLLHYSDEVFVYQDGSFVPVIGPDLIERLVKAPDRFELKRASRSNLRSAVFDQLKAIVSNGDVRRGTRNETTLVIVRPLISFVTSLPAYARSSKQIGGRAAAVCQALLQTREPDALIFTELPKACGLAPFDETSNVDDALAVEYANRLQAALSELGTAYDRLLDDVRGLLRESLSVPPDANLREDLRARARHLTRQVIDRRMRGFLMTVADEGLDDSDWLEAVALTISERPPTNWSDHDVDRFHALLAERARWFRRLEVLHYNELPSPQSGFVTRRVTVTSPDGAESAELVSYDKASAADMERLLDELVEKVQPQLGTTPELTLLGLLADRLLDRAGASESSQASLREATR